MILVDTGIWIDHLKLNQPDLSALLQRRQALMHPMVLGELLLGGLPSARLIADLHDLPTAVVARLDEVRLLIMTHPLSGTGIGYVDAHLVASCLLTPGQTLWTRDSRLRRVAEGLSVSAGPTLH